MKTLILTFIIVFISNIYAQQKLAQTGFNFLSVTCDARSSAIAEAVTSFQNYSGALFHNPASMAQMDKFFNANFSINQWIADIKHITTSLILSPFNGDMGVIGFSLQSVDYGEVEGTMVANNEKGYIDTKIMKPTALAIGLGYAKMLNDKFGVGGQIKYVYQKLGESVIPTKDGTIEKENKASALAFDFGTVYKTGFKSITFGMSVRNFSKEIKYEEEGFQLPLNFIIGISANLFDFINVGLSNQNFMISVDYTHPRSRPEQLKIGAEYQFMNILFLRGGYIIGNYEDNVTFGIGVFYSGFNIDYSYTPYGIFNNVQRLTARISF
ncbi:MAG: PorV/PorQ family protein [Melioribacter sp.]|nr:PorV/PorQ family protein [Melioribacter sp.]